MVRCHYEVLEVERDAQDDELKKAYRRLALKVRKATALRASLSVSLHLHAMPTLTRRCKHVRKYSVASSPAYSLQLVTCSL